MKTGSRRPALRAPRLSRRGISFADILVAIVILSIALVVIFGHIVFTRKGAHATLEELKGIGFAQDLIDRVKCTPYKDVPEMKDALDDASFAGLKIADKEIRRVEEPFVRKLSVEEFTEEIGGFDFKMKKVEVRVTWTVSNYDEKVQKVSRDVHVTLSTIIRKLVN